MDRDVRDSLKNAHRSPERKSWTLHKSPKSNSSRESKIHSPSNRRQSTPLVSPNTKNRLSKIFKSIRSPDSGSNSARSSSSSSISKKKKLHLPSNIPFSDLTASEREIMGHNMSHDDNDIAELQELFHTRDLSELDDL